MVIQEEMFLCRACREMRPYFKISVKKVDRSERRGFPEGTWTENFQYCNDRPKCQEASKVWNGYAAPSKDTKNVTNP